LQEIPDFTQGKWKTRRNNFNNRIEY